MKHQIIVPQEDIARMGLKKARDFYDLLKEINYNRKIDSKQPISFEPIPTPAEETQAEMVQPQKPNGKSTQRQSKKK